MSLLKFRQNYAVVRIAKFQEISRIDVEIEEDSHVVGDL